jgi:hypothetical protein
VPVEEVLDLGLRQLRIVFGLTFPGYPDTAPTRQTIADPARQFDCLCAATHEAASSQLNFNQRLGGQFGGGNGLGRHRPIEQTSRMSGRVPVDVNGLSGSYFGPGRARVDTVARTKDWIAPCRFSAGSFDVFIEREFEASLREGLFGFWGS